MAQITNTDTVRITGVSRVQGREKGRERIQCHQEVHIICKFMLEIDDSKYSALPLLKVIGLGR